MSMATFGDVLNTLLTIFALVACFNLPLFAFMMITRLQKKRIINTRDARSKYGVLYAGLKTNRKTTWLTPFFFLLRRAVFVLSVFIWQNRPLAQVTVAIYF